MPAILWIVGINILSFIQFGLDKYCARANWRRIPEKTLVITAFLGGYIGAKLGQKAFRHKTRKEPFRTHLNLAGFGFSVLLLLAVGLSYFQLQ